MLALVVLFPTNRATIQWHFSPNGFHISAAYIFYSHSYNNMSYQISSFSHTFLWDLSLSLFSSPIFKMKWNIAYCMSVAFMFRSPEIQHSKRHRWYRMFQIVQAKTWLHGLFWKVESFAPTSNFWNWRAMCLLKRIWSNCNVNTLRTPCTFRMERLRPHLISCVLSRLVCLSPKRHTHTDNYSIKIPLHFDKVLIESA